MEGVLRRHLLPGEEVHHLDANKTNNHPENLELWTRSHPAGARVKDHVKWAKKILGTYEPTSLAIP
ncbi:hypothetical protein ABIB54_000496 [Frigoribacterium sp. UYMn621]